MNVACIHILPRPDRCRRAGSVALSRVAEGHRVATP